MSPRVVHDERFVDHAAPGGHPECPERLETIVRALRAAGLWQRLEQTCPTAAPRQALERIHHPAYLDFLVEQVAGQRGFLNADTFYAPASVELATLAAGAALQLVEAALDDRIDRGLALVRPPGHHAEARRGKGFCLLGNVAVAAAAARARGARVAVVDFDVHHGDGTQQAFWEDPDLLFISTHRFGPGVYPGTGSRAEQGGGAGVGSTVNLPFGPGAGNADYLAAFDQVVGPKLAAFGADLLLVSAGFDAHREDPLADATVDDAGFDGISLRLVDWAAAHASGRLVVVLEGGYALPALGRGVVALVRRMLGLGPRSEGGSR